ncbi:allergen asp f 4 [Fusarium longipes]|uniref:Allergen asp f 4 n=1 Tax=Fusarium longipes TaxID=694270 RepID=A0A395T647_9HYPO|nr:allergen asp f 4 [Fusarium longipes]
MKFSSSAVLLAAALGASAHPSGHAHQRAHAKRDFIVANNPVTVYETHVVTAAAAPATAAPVAPVVAEPKEEESVPKSVAANGPSASDVPKATKGKKHSSGSGYKPFCGGKKVKRATLEDIAATGNTGTASDYGCNMMTVDSDVADKYTYTTTFKNDHDEDKTCACWNKIGPKGLIDGFFAQNIPLHFDVPAQSSQVVAFDEDSQGGCACSSKEIPTTAMGLVAGTWLEFDFGSERNGGWSGADASCLVSAKEKLNIPGLRVCGHGTCSTIYPGGTGENAYLGGMEAEDGIGLNLNQKQVRLTVDIDYSK